MRSGVGIIASAHVVPSGGSGPFSDNFNRADGALGTPWAVVEGALAIVSNQVAPPSGGPHTSRVNQTFAADQWAEADLAGFSAGGHGIGPALRVNGSDLYYMWNGGSFNTVEIVKRVSGTYTTIGPGVACPAAFKGRLEAQGSTIRAYVNGVLAITTTDSALATGQPGILGNAGSGPTLDNYRCGPLPYVPLFVDDFNRADATTLGPAWYAPGWGIVSNQARRGSGVGGGDFATYQTSLGSPDHWAELLLPAVNDAGNQYMVVDARRPSGTDSDFNGTAYMVFVSPAGQVIIGKAISGSYSDVQYGTNLGSWPGAVPLRIEVQGSTIRGYVNNVLHVTGTDTSITTGNWAGMNANQGPCDNFRCGALPWTP